MRLHLAQAAGEPSGGLAGWAVDLVNALGGPGISLLSALDSMVSVVPADLVLPLVGFFANQGAINLGVAAAWATTGSVVGSLVIYILGMLLGRDRARALLVKVPGITSKSVDRAETWFAQHGAKAVLFGRMLPGVRTLISLPAGVERMSVPRFVAFTAIGSLMWNSTLLTAGYVLGSNWQMMATAVGIFTYAFSGAAVVAIAYFIVRRVRAKRA
jgi:membrane protein DedA with SNARE-associated domain